MLQVAHVTGDVQFPKTKDGKVNLGWAAGQVAPTADFSHGSWFWTHFSGGLNYQVCPHEWLFVLAEACISTLIPRKATLQC